jgi:hypothetical protein
MCGLPRSRSGWFLCHNIAKMNPARGVLFEFITYAVPSNPPSPPTRYGQTHFSNPTTPGKPHDAVPPNPLSP